MNYLKKLIVSISIISLFAATAFADVVTPIKWKNSINDLGNNTYELVFKATVDAGWHLYGLNIADGGPIATSFNYDDLNNFELVGDISSSVQPEVKFDKTFEMDLELFHGTVVFKQKIKKSGDNNIIKGYIEFMACDDSQCLPPSEIDFEYNLSDKAVTEAAKLPQRESATPAFNAPQPKEKAEPVLDESSDNKTDEQALVIETATAPKVETKTSTTTQPENSKPKKSLWILFWEAFSKGLVAIFTPCVFPIIPLTVAFFMRDNTTSRRITQAIFFGLSIVAIYSMVGLIAGLTQVDIMAATKHWLANIIIAAVLITFAASFFGLFELVLPSKLSTKLDGEVDKGGLLAPFFLALVTAVVSFSCVGPIAGVAIASAMNGEISAPVIAMSGFGTAFALPFVLIGIFPGLLKGMPKSGGWLNAIKVFFAFIMLIASYIFLGNTQWGIFNRDVIIALNITTFVLLGVYLLGKIKFAHDSDVPHISIPRLLLAIVAFSTALYMLPGLFGSPLKVMAPFLPTQETSEFSLTTPTAPIATAVIDQELCDETPKHSEIKGMHLPHNLKGYFDYEEALACAKEQNKPVFLDFVGHSCKNCKKMYADVWSDPEILSLLQQFVIVALYTDERTDLPEDEWVKSSIDGKLKKTIGKRNIDFEISKFESNALPLYSIVDTDGNVITDPGYFTYNLSVDELKAYLQQGLKNFKQ